MTRMRYIKPEFWTDGRIIKLSVWARLFYIGTWNHTICDRGHLPDDADGLKLRILPADDVDGQQLVDELLDAGRLVRIEFDGGRTFLQVPRLADHQKTDPRWKPRCPACALLADGESPQTLPSSADTPPSSSETHDDLQECVVGGEGRGREGRGGGGSAQAATTPFCPLHPQGTDQPCRTCQVARLAWRREVEKWNDKVAVPSMPPPSSYPDCPKHVGYPMSSRLVSCPRCAEEKAA